MSNRLAAMRNQREAQNGANGQGAPGQAYEMNDTNGTDTGMRAFYDEVDAIKAMIRQFNADVTRISELQSRMLQDVGGANNADTAGQLDELVQQTRDTSTQIRQRLQMLASQKAENSRDARMRTDQIGQIKAKFTAAIQDYQRVEQQYRTKYRERVERQFRIVKPDATPQEVQDVVENTNGGDQIFAQALTNSSADRYREGRQRYQDVQERHQEIIKIEGTLAELAQLFHDVNMLVLQQDEQIDVVNTQAFDAANNVEAAGGQLDKAVASARAARRKKIICFWITLLILVIIGIIIGIVVWQEVDKKKSS